VVASVEDEDESDEEAAAVTVLRHGGVVVVEGWLRWPRWWWLWWWLWLWWRARDGELGAGARAAVGPSRRMPRCRPETPSRGIPPIVARWAAVAAAEAEHPLHPARCPAAARALASGGARAAAAAVPVSSIATRALQKQTDF